VLDSVHMSEMGAEFGTLHDKAKVAKPMMALCDHPFAGIVDATMLTAFSWQGLEA